MKFMDMLRNMKQLQAITVVLLVSNLILGLGNVYALITVSNMRERVVLVPPNLDKKAQIAWAGADKEYLKSFGLYMATLVGNIQPKSSSVVLDSVGVFMDPAIYNDFRRQLLAVIEDPVFKSSGSVISFLPSSVQYEAETTRVFITGTIVTSTAGSQKYQKQVTYEVGTVIREGRPYVTHFTSYEGNVPRTVTWWVQKSSRDGQAIPEHALPDRWKAQKAAVVGPTASDFEVMNTGKTGAGEPVADIASPSANPPASAPQEKKE
ncbi:type IV conjugative transfer system protein TraE [Acidovorax sp. sic0104]|uniref:type IV conjugative transfer system protein TraE n=1 Tax=Acidovorax sp. sic0104 TaxID=2854784 RepID=UPI001C483795|nr:type IV conjugative transfer system protein TraE [Acidovorax sp. sic0104]MBV7542102.1 type IV conjugative transfer system protein TraE [Acidovorax sp. sic0104]